MNPTNCTFNFILDGHKAFEVPNSLSRQAIPELINPTSDHSEDASEDRITEVNAEILRKQVREAKQEDIMTSLPILGRKGVVIKGWSHILAGYPKAGKTELITRVLSEWIDEQVLYITEESQHIWSIRLATLSPIYQLKHVSLYFGLGATSETVLKRIQEGSESVVVIDTIRTFLGFVDETDNSEVNRVLIPYIKTARQHNKTILFVHHVRKGGGHYGQGISGAHAFLGTVDIGIEVKRHRNHNRRELSGHGRIGEIETFLYERLDDGSFQVLGSSKGVTLEEVKKRVTAVLNTECKTTKQVVAALNNPQPSADQVLKALEALANEEKVIRNPPMNRGKLAGVTYKWHIRSESS